MSVSYTTSLTLYIDGNFPFKDDLITAFKTLPGMDNIEQIDGDNGFGNKLITCRLYMEYYMDKKQLDEELPEFKNVKMWRE